MINVSSQRKAFLTQGYVTIKNVFSDVEVDNLIRTVNEADSANETFRKSKELFAIRQFLKEVPGVLPLLFTKTFSQLIGQIGGEKHFVVKSIYFDKHGESNWFVSYHQDLTISVEKKADVSGFGPWTVKQNQYAVQPPQLLLENNFTIRIHLDDTDENNGFDERSITTCQHAGDSWLRPLTAIAEKSKRSIGSVPDELPKESE